MRVSLLDAKNTATKLLELIKKHKKMHFCVAWATNGHVSDCLLEHRRKFLCIDVGINRFVTEPNFLEQLIGVKNAHVIQSKKGIFHPKIYYFFSDNISEAVVGSSNFTDGGLGENIEANLHLKGKREEQIFQQIEAQLADYEEHRRPITRNLVDWYRRQYEVNKAQQGQKNAILPDKSKQGTYPLVSDLLTMSWSEYYCKILSFRESDTAERLKVLRRARGIFKTTSVLKDLDVEQWRAIAGLLTKKQAEHKDTNSLKLNGTDWGWFGSMGPARTFRTLINSKNVYLARAMDAIPLDGEVTHAHFETFMKSFKRAFAGKPGASGIGTATRLLAMKRPDTFVCVNGANKNGLSKALGVKLTLNNYWQDAVVPIRTAPWYNFDLPRDLNQRKIWLGRVALLDAIYYERPE